MRYLPLLCRCKIQIISVGERKAQAKSHAAAMQCIDKLGLPVGVTARGVENSVKPLAHATQGRPSVGHPSGGSGGVAEAF